jgi:hypothetical protein
MCGFMPEDSDIAEDVVKGLSDLQEKPFSLDDLELPAAYIINRKGNQKVKFNYLI